MCNKKHIQEHAASVEVLHSVYAEKEFEKDTKQYA